MPDEARLQQPFRPAQPATSRRQRRAGSGRGHPAPRASGRPPRQRRVRRARRTLSGGEDLRRARRADRRLPRRRAPKRAGWWGGGRGGPGRCRSSSCRSWSRRSSSATGAPPGFWCRSFSGSSSGRSSGAASAGALTVGPLGRTGGGCSGGPHARSGCSHTLDRRGGSRRIRMKWPRRSPPEGGRGRIALHGGSALVRAVRRLRSSTNAPKALRTRICDGLAPAANTGSIRLQTCCLFWLRWP